MFIKVINIIKKAGKKLIFFYNFKNYRNFNIQYKPDCTPVTNIDYYISNFIIKKLHSINPKIPVLSEEFLSDINICKQWSKYWLIDPIDGTKEFLNGIPEFAINISLIENNKPCFGCIYIPFYKILYYSYLGKSWKETKGIKKRIFVKNKNIRTIVVSRFHYLIKKNINMNSFENFLILKLGSSWKFGLIAEGKAQYYPRFNNTSIWDTAAGELIVLNAGGFINTLHGDKLDYSFNNDTFLNPGFHVFT